MNREELEVQRVRERIAAARERVTQGSLMQECNMIGFLKCVLDKFPIAAQLGAELNNLGRAWRRRSKLSMRKHAPLPGLRTKREGPRWGRVACSHVRLMVSPQRKRRPEAERTHLRGGFERARRRRFAN